MQFKLNKIINSEELKNNKYFKGSVEIALLNALYKEKETLKVLLKFYHNY